MNRLDEGKSSLLVRSVVALRIMVVGIVNLFVVETALRSLAAATLVQLILG